MRSQMIGRAIDWVWLQSIRRAIFWLFSRSVSCSSATLGISDTDVLTNQSVTQSLVWRGRLSTNRLMLYPVNQTGA